MNRYRGKGRKTRNPRVFTSMMPLFSLSDEGIKGGAISWGGVEERERKMEEADSRLPPQHGKEPASAISNRDEAPRKEKKGEKRRGSHRLRTEPSPTLMTWPPMPKKKKKTEKEETRRYN